MVSGKWRESAGIMGRRWAESWAATPLARHSLARSACQAVANVHGARHTLFGENATLGEVGLRTTVGLEEDFGVDVGGFGHSLEQGQPSGGGPQRSRHGYEMPWTGGFSGHGCALDGPDQGNGDEGGGRLDHIAAYDGKVGLLGHTQRSFV